MRRKLQRRLPKEVDDKSICYQGREKLEDPFLGKNVTTFGRHRDLGQLEGRTLVGGGFPQTRTNRFSMLNFLRVFLALLLFTTLGVGGRASTPPEFLVENLEIEEVIEYFRACYPQVQFWRRNPTGFSFYAAGTREEVLAIKRETAEMDQAGKIPNLPVASEVALKYLRPDDAMALLRYRVPNVSGSAGQDRISLEGPPKLRNEAGLALLEIDRPSVWIKLTREQLAQLPTGVCKLPTRGTTDKFDCPKGDCGGFLHLTGLRPGDMIRWSAISSPGKPFWVVLRNKAETNIYVEFY